MQLNTIASLALAIAFATGAGSAFAEDVGKSGKPLSAQQQRMKNCNADAKEQSLKGPERKTFMSSCLKGSAASAPVPAAEKTVTARAETPLQLKRKACSADAKAQGLKGAERKTFVAGCVKAEDASAH